METNEHAILLDISSGGKNGKYHSAILTTYAIDLIHFDNQLLNLLHRKQICSINVFADAVQMDKSMEFASPDYVKRIGKEYCINSINAVGAFHPKINFFVGDESALVVFGSGNLTVPGHGKNHEVFTGFMVDEANDSHRPLIEECWQYVTQFSKQCGEFVRNRIDNEIPNNCTFLDNSFKIDPHKMWQVQDGLYAALLYNERTSGILQQISKLVPLNDVQKVTVISPYFDEDGESLVTLSQLCPNAVVNVLMEKECILPPCKLSQNNRVNFYDFSKTKRGKIVFKTYDRRLHAKMLHFKTGDSEYCMIGSANATTAGLGTLTQRGINEEFCVLYHSENKDSLSALGLKTKERLSVPIINLNRCDANVAGIKSKGSKLRLLSVEYEAGELSVICSESVSERALLVIDNGTETLKYELKQSGNCRLVAAVKLDNKQYTCYLIDNAGNRVSNKAFIDWVELLATTNPSKTSRSINKVITRIENDGYEGMEVADMLSEVMWDLVNGVEEKVSFKINASNGNKNGVDETLPDLKYNPQYDNGNVGSGGYSQIDHTSKLIECIEECMTKKKRLIEDAIIDEEEDGSAEESNDRGIEVQADISAKKHFKECAELSTSVLKKYQKMLDKRSVQARITGSNTITKDDLNFFSLSMFAAIEICYLNRPRYNFDDIAVGNRSVFQKKFYESLERSICVDGLAALEKFVRFCNAIKWPKSKDESYNKVACRTMKYAILYGTLFDRKASENSQAAIGNRVLAAIRSLIAIFGKPSIEYLRKGLEPLSEIYDYFFRVSEIEDYMRVKIVKE